MENTYLIVGLGNPGREYRETRHNVGFMLLDQLAVVHDARFSRLQANALIANFSYHDHIIILAKPQTYMNLSGQAVRGLLRYYKFPLTNILIVHDDIDLPVGTIRLRPDGGSAGQKGMSSILEYLGTDEFARLRMGIGRPSGHTQITNYVLQVFSNEEMSIISDMLSRASKAIYAWVREGLEKAMNQFNSVNRDL